MGPPGGGASGRGGGVCKVDWSTLAGWGSPGWELEWGLVVGPSEVKVACAYVIGVAEVPGVNWDVVAVGRGGLK